MKYSLLLPDETICIGGHIHLISLFNRQAA